MISRAGHLACRAGSKSNNLCHGDRTQGTDEMRQPVKLLVRYPESTLVERQKQSSRLLDWSDASASQGT